MDILATLGRNNDDNDDDDDTLMRPSSSQPPQQDQVLSRSQQQDIRRRKRRRLYRLLKNPDTLPSFLKAIDADKNCDNGDTMTTERQSDATKINYSHPSTDAAATDENDFLLEPPIVIIDVDEYLGLKKRNLTLPDNASSMSSIMIPQQQLPFPDKSMSLSMPIAASATLSSPSGTHVLSPSLSNPAEEGYYEGTRLMAMPEDQLYLTEMQQWTRQNLEYFSASIDDVQTSQSGRRTPTVRGKVGIRCIHCAKAIKIKMNQRAKSTAGSSSSESSATTNATKISWPAGSVSYPLNFSGLYSSAIQKPQLHFEKCPYMPTDTHFLLLLEKSRSSSTGSVSSFSTSTRKRMLKDGLTATMYWLISCHRIGLIELGNNNGIRFGRDVALEPLPFESTRVKVERDNPQLVAATSIPPNKQPQPYRMATIPDRVFSTATAAAMTSVAAPVEPIEVPKEAAEVVKEALAEDDDPTKLIALNEDRPSLSDFMFLTLKQAAVCHAMPADFETRGKKTKLLRLGFTGFCCRWCNQFRSFSSSSDNLASAVSNSFVLHLLKCPYTPPDIQQALQTLKRIHSKQMNQLPYGSQSRVFVDLWARMRAADKKGDHAISDQIDTPGPVGEGHGDSITNDEDDEYIPDDTGSAERQPRGGSSSRQGRRCTSQITYTHSSPVPTRGLNFPVPDNEEARQVLKEFEENWDPSKNDNLIRPEDRDLVSDYVFLCMRQIKIAVPTSSDFRGNRRNNILSRMAGMCCVHCCDLPGSQFIMPSGRTFPSAPDNMASALNSSLYNHMMNCPGLPMRLRNVMSVVRKIHSQQCASLPFGSQRRFFNRVYQRLKEIPVDLSLLQASEKEETHPSRPPLPDLSSILGTYAFVHRTAKGSGPTKPNEYWQCMGCRMVPYEYRAPGSLHFSIPSINEAQEHARICQKDGIWWDQILTSMTELSDKFGPGDSLINKESFCRLVSAVIGTDGAVFDIFMNQLKRLDGADASPSSNTAIWRQLPASVDFEKVQDAFLVLSRDLNLSSETLEECSEFAEFLQLLQCNFQVPPRKRKKYAEDTAGDEDAMYVDNAITTENSQAPVLHKDNGSGTVEGVERMANVNYPLKLDVEVLPHEQNVAPDSHSEDLAENPSSNVAAQDEEDRRTTSSKTIEVSEKLHLKPASTSATIGTSNFEETERANQEPMDASNEEKVSKSEVSAPSETGGQFDDF